MLQSGAQAVLASLWPVSDYATYLLIVYFAQQWLPDMKSKSPATALAQAQEWLRRVTWREIQEWNPLTISQHTENLQQKEFAKAGRNRLDLQAAWRWIRAEAKMKDPDTCPFESPVYWAGFQVTGW